MRVYFACLKIQFIIIARTYTQTMQSILVSHTERIFTYTYNLLLNEQNNIHWNTFTRARTHTHTSILSNDWILHANTGTSLHSERQTESDSTKKRERSGEERRESNQCHGFSVMTLMTAWCIGMCVLHTTCVLLCIWRDLNYQHKWKFHVYTNWLSWMHVLERTRVHVLVFTLTYLLLFLVPHFTSLVLSLIRIFRAKNFR